MDYETAAQLMDDHFEEAIISIMLAPGEEPEETEIAKGVKKVDHPDDAEETLVVELNKNNYENIEEKAKEVSNKLDHLNFRTEIIPSYFGKDQFWWVIGVLED